MRVLLDTNVLVRVLLEPAGPAAKLLAQVNARRSRISCCGRRDNIRTNDRPSRAPPDIGRGGVKLRP